MQTAKEKRDYVISVIADLCLEWRATDREIPQPMYAEEIYNQMPITLLEMSGSGPSFDSCNFDELVRCAAHDVFKTQNYDEV